MKIIIITNIILIPFIVRVLLSRKTLVSLTKYSWKPLLRLKQIFFFFVIMLMTLFSEDDFLDMPELILSVVLNSIFNIGVYYLVYSYLITHFYLANKYPVFILYTFICFLFSCIFRILWEHVLFDIDLNKEDHGMSFIYNIYVYQGGVILVASFLGITRDKFILEKELADVRMQKEEIYPTVLQSKLNPHFLLNTLNSIYNSSFTSSGTTSHSILQLSKLLKYTIYESEKEKIKVTEALSSVEALAALYQLKYKNQLTLVLDIQNKEVLELIEIPSSLLLTLFENAVRRSIIGNNSDNFIKLTCKSVDFTLFYEIINSSDQYKKLSVKSTYKGSDNDTIIHLLEKHYPEKFDFFSEKDGDDWYKTLLKINLN